MNPALETLMLHPSLNGMAGDTQALFLGASPHEGLPMSVIGWQPYRPLASAWLLAGRPLEPCLPDRRFPRVLVMPGKSRDETLAWMALGRDHLLPGGTMVVSMPNTAGASRFERELSQATGPVESIQKNKCRAFAATDRGDWNEALFDEWRTHATAKPIPNSHFLTQAGVFSCDHIDPGSQWLADHLPSSLQGRLADLGAGWGFLSNHVLNHCPKVEHIDLFEADSRALDCARMNLAAHGAKAAFHWHDVTLGLDDRYDAIVTNPPFHTGQTTDVDLGRAFLTTAAQALKPHGHLHLVANRQLPYESLLTSLGLRWRCVAENTTYKLLFARKC